MNNFVYITETQYYGPQLTPFGRKKKTSRCSSTKGNKWDTERLFNFSPKSQLMRGCHVQNGARGEGGREGGEYEIYTPAFFFFFFINHRNVITIIAKARVSKVKLTKVSWLSVILILIHWGWNLFLSPHH